jgi:DNA (cytosine-5)-methyltransferase 1
VKVKVLSLFDGMSCGQIALNRIGITPDAYYASELDKYAIKVTQENYPDTVQLGDVTGWRDWDIDWASIDLLIGGSPCQGFSFAGKQLAFDDPRSKLFFVYVDILNHIKSVNPSVKFMLENVKMKKEYLAVISEQLGVEPVFINSALVSAQNRQRYYWCNWKVEQPEDKGVVLADILEGDQVDREKSHCLDANYYKGGNLKSYFEKNRRQLVFTNPAAIVGRKLDESGKRNDTLPIKQTQCLEVHDHGKSRCLSTVQKDTVVSSLPPGRYSLPVQTNPSKKAGGKQPYMQERCFYVNGKSHALTAAFASRTNVDGVGNGKEYRKLTPIECERLQTVPDNYTNHVSNTQRYKMLGNGWTVDVVAHIFSQGLI